MNLNLTLGTQTFGSDTSQNESFKILDKCFENGIRSIDTVERYPFPEQEETFGETEKIIGSWIKKNHINSRSFYWYQQLVELIMVGKFLDLEDWKK